MHSPESENIDQFEYIDNTPNTKGKTTVSIETLEHFDAPSIKYEHSTSLRACASHTFTSRL